MAGLRKDVELIFRGEDRASPTIKNVRKSVADLTGAIDEQLTAAAKGEGSIDDLAKAYQKLKAAQGDVGEITKLAAAYENQTKKLADQTAKVADAKTKLEGLNAQVAAAESPTKRLQNARDAAERSLNAALAKEKQLAAAVTETGAALDAAGGDSKDFARTQDLIRQAAIETARALRDAAAAMDQFKGAQAKGKANNAAAAELQQFNSLAAGSGLPQAQITFISGLENRLEALKAAISEDQASMARLNAELEKGGFKSAAGSAAVMKTELDNADAAAKRLQATTGFKQLATQIEAGARDISRFGATADTGAASAQRLADTVQGILNPTQAASASLDGLDAVIAQAESVTDGAKRRLSQYNAELNNLQSASAGLANIARSIDDFRQQEAAVASARAEMERAQTEVIQLSRAIQTAETPTQEMATNLERAKIALDKAGAAFGNEATKLNAMDAALKRAGVDTNNLAAAEDRVTIAATRAAAAQAKVTSKTTGKGSLFGLNPNEMQNLGFQINDIVVSLGSGQAPMRVLLQQGAQIGQIIPGAFGRIAAALPILIPVGVTLGGIALAMKHVSDEAERLKTGQGIVSQLGDGTATTAAQFADLAKQMDDLGVKATDARAALVQLAADGLTTEQMQAYLDTAKAVSEVTGVDLKDALETVRTSFQGGMEDILNLQKETGVYSDVELDLIQKLYDQGQADDARTVALEIYRAKMQTVAENQAGPWKDATDKLSDAWSNFLDWLGHTTPIDNARRQLRQLQQDALFVATILDNISKGKGADIAGARNAVYGGGGSSSVTVKLPPARPAGNPNRTTTAGRTTLQADREALAIAQARTPAEKRAAEAIKTRRDAAEEAAKLGLSSAEAQQHIEMKMAAFNATQDAADAKRDAAAAKRGAAAERRKDAAARAAARRAQAAQNQIDNAEEGIQKQLDQLDANVGKKSGETLQAKLDAVDEQYKKLFRDIDDYSKKTNGKGLIGGLTIKEVTDHIEAQKKILKGYVQIGDAEGQINDLEKTRKERLDEIADKVARGIIKPEDGLTQSNAVIDEMAGKITKIAQDTLVFAQAFEKLHPSPEIEAFIAKLQTTIQNNSGGQNVRAKNDVTQGAVDAQMASLNKLVSDRNALVEHENQLVQAGLESYSTAQDKIQGFYRNTNKLITDQIALILRLAASWKNGTPDQQRAYAALAATLGTVAQEAQGADASFVNLKAKVDDLLTTQIVGFIDSVAQAFARWVSGQSDVMGFLEAVGRALLNMIANILQTVATLIIEALVLDAVDKATGGILKPLLQITAAAVQIRHEGGVVGDVGGRSRNVSPLAFAGAPRYHTGGIAGLAPDEHAAILRKGEEVLTENDPRHRDNGGLSPAGGSGPVGLRQVLAFGDDEIANAMNGSAGEQVFVTFVKRNRATIRQILDR